jgi:hypothetical protein
MTGTATDFGITGRPPGFIEHASNYEFEGSNSSSYGQFNFRYSTIACGREVMLDASDELADMLLKYSSSSATQRPNPDTRALMVSRHSRM